MNIIKPYVYLYEDEINSNKLYNIERAARLCYKSENKTGDYDSEFLKNIIKSGHESVIEHEKITVYFVVDRGISHELVRHRIGSFSQESTRYCNYSLNKFGNEISVIEPYFYIDRPTLFAIWMKSCEIAEENYLQLLNSGTPQEARSVLPNSLKTEIAVTFNFREWRHFFVLRCAKEAHPQMQQVTIPLLCYFKEVFNPIFEDIKYNEQFPIDHYVKVKIIK